MKLLNILMVALLAVFVGACGGAATETATEGKDSKKTEDTKNSADREEETSAGEDSPKAAFEEFARAWKTKDAATVKKRISADSMKEIEDEFDTSKDKLKVNSVDELLVKQMDAGAPFKVTPKTRNEKIDGDSATIEVDNEGAWETFTLIKEDGMWKVDLTKI